MTYANLSRHMPYRKNYMPFFGDRYRARFPEKIPKHGNIYKLMQRYEYALDFFFRKTPSVLNFFQDSRIRVKWHCTHRLCHSHFLLSAQNFFRRTTKENKILLFGESRWVGRFFISWISIWCTNVLKRTALSRKGMLRKYSVRPNYVGSSGLWIPSSGKKCVHSLWHERLRFWYFWWLVYWTHVWL